MNGESPNDQNTNPKEHFKFPAATALELACAITEAAADPDNEVLRLETHVIGEGDVRVEYIHVVTKLWTRVFNDSVICPPWCGV